jgi:Leucine-rich repeat (LRR) protein
LNIKTLKFHHCKYVDDWFVARVAGSFSDTLENLDISNNKLITDNGLMALGKLRNLKYLNLSDLKQCKNLEYISFLLEQSMPNLQIEGVDFESDQVLENVQKRMELEEQEMEKKIEGMDKENRAFVQLLIDRQNEFKELAAK